MMVLFLIVQVFLLGCDTDAVDSLILKSGAKRLIEGRLEFSGQKVVTEFNTKCIVLFLKR